MPISFGIEEALDILEGLVAGGLTSLATGIIASAVANLPNTFINTSYISPLSAIAGVLAFVGITLHNIRGRRQI